MLPRCFSVHPSARTIVTGIAPAAAPLRQFFMRFPLQSPLLQIAHLHRIRQRLTPPLPSAGSHEKCDRIFRGFPPTGGGSRSAGIGATVPVSQTANSHFCNCHHSRNRTAPLPLWGRDGVGFSDAASVFFRPSVCQNHHHRYRACFFTHLQGISAMSPVADDKPTPHPATINPTPALPCRGREPIGGNWGDRSRILPLGGRFCDCSKMANATPSPTLPRCGLRPAREEAERRKCKQPLSMPQPIYPLPCRTRQRRAAGEGRGGGSAIHHDNLT